MSDSLLEWAEYNSNYYGTPAKPVDTALASGANVLLEIEVQGARQIRQSRPDSTLIFISPPSMDILEERLRGRGNTAEEDIVERLRIASSEIAEADLLFDHIVINDDLDRAVTELVKLISNHE